MVLIPRSSIEQRFENITSIKNDGPATFTIGGNEFKFDGGNVNMGGNNITNLKSGGDVVNNAANIGDVTRISKANDCTHCTSSIQPCRWNYYILPYDAADKSVTLEYNDDGNGANQANTIAKSTCLVWLIKLKTATPSPQMRKVM